MLLLFPDVVHSSGKSPHFDLKLFLPFLARSSLERLLSEAGILSALNKHKNWTEGKRHLSDAPSLHLLEFPKHLERPKEQD